MKKINILIISGVSAIILFVVLTIVQNKLQEQESTISVYISNIDIVKDTKIQEDAYKQLEVPVSLVMDGNVITNENELVGKYAKENINKGQILFKQDIAEKEELKIVEADPNLERIAVKIKSSENAVGYQIKPEDRVHLYFTGKSSVIKNTIFNYQDMVNNISEDNLLQTEKILENTEVLGIYDEFGRSFYNSEYSGLDTIVIAVEPQKAELINNLRNQGTFDITR